jgi:hypothetical protein
MRVTHSTTTVPVIRVSGPLCWDYSRGTVLHPRQTFTRLLQEPAGLGLALFAMALVTFAYAVGLYLLALGGAQPTLTPWITIPLEDYYRWQAVFWVPLMLLSWVLAGGTVHLLAKLFRGSGTFEGTLALFGFAIATPTVVTLIPDALTGLLSTIGLLNQEQWGQAITTPGSLPWLFVWVIMLLYTIGLAVLLPLAVSTAQRLRVGPSVLLGVVGLVLYQGVLLIFGR